MPNAVTLGRVDGGADNYSDAGTAGAVAIANQTTLNASTTVLASALAAVSIGAAKAVALPLNQPAGTPIVVTNVSAGANTLTVFPPWNNTLATPAAAGGKIYGAATGAPTANAGVSVAQGRTVLFYPHPNGIDFTAVWGAVA